MKVAVYGIPFPQGLAMTNRLKKYCKALSEKDIDIKVYSLCKDYEHGVYERIQYEHIKEKRLIHRKIDRFINAPVHAINVSRIADSCEVILINRFRWITLLLIAFVAHKKGVRIVMELNENPESSGGSRLDPVWIRKMRRWLMLNLSFKYIDGFICITKALEDLVIKHKGKNAKTVIIPILCDLPDETIRTTSDAIKELSPYIFHAGYIDPQKDGIYSVFEAFISACKQKTTNLKFVLTIRFAIPSILNKIDKLIKDNHIEDRVIWLGFIPSEEVKKYRENAAMGIVNKPTNWQNSYNFPTKLGDLLSSGIPVIASRTGEISRYLTDETAYLVDANNVEQIATKIIEILENPEKAKEIAENGKTLAIQSFYYKNHSEKLSDFFKSLLIH